MSKKSNAFYFFMLDYKAKHRKENLSMSEVSYKAGLIWQGLSDEEKRPFNERAKVEKERKLTNLGEIKDVVAKGNSELLEQECHKKKAIERIVNVAAKTQTLDTEVFYVIHIIDFCFANVTNKYYPAEIALVSFTLRSGVLIENVYHKIIKPGKLPVGYTFQAKSISSETHQIPVPDQTSTNESNLEELFNELIYYLSPRSSALPPLYTDESNISKVDSILRNLCIDMDESEDMFKVYSLQYLFYQLRNNVAADNLTFPTVNVAALELDKDIYEFTPGIACKFHEGTDVPNECCKSKVIRKIYTICDHCCKDLGINLIPGKHVPLQAAIDYVCSESSYAQAGACGPSHSSSALSESNMSFVSASSTLQNYQSDNDGFETARSRLRKMRNSNNWGSSGSSSSNSNGGGRGINFNRRK